MILPSELIITYVLDPAAARPVPDGLLGALRAEGADHLPLSFI